MLNQHYKKPGMSSNRFYSLGFVAALILLLVVGGKDSLAQNLVATTNQPESIFTGIESEQPILEKPRLTQEMNYIAFLNASVNDALQDTMVIEKNYGNIQQEELFSVRNIGIFTVVLGSVAGLVYMLSQVIEAPF